MVRWVAWAILGACSVAPRVLADCSVGPITCFADSVEARILGDANVNPYAIETQSWCAQLCSDRGNILAGVEYGFECYCGDVLADGAVATPGECTQPCAGDASGDACGNANRIGIFAVNCSGTPVPPPVPTTPPFANSCTENFAGGARLPYPYCDASLSIDARLDDLLPRLTVQEKCAALDTAQPAIQRLGLPSIPSGEGLHGVVSGCGASVGGNTGCATSFPCPTALGATFDVGLVGAVGRAVGIEARALNNQGGLAGLYLFTPNINPSRDPRWGRTQVVPGESPELTSQYARLTMNELYGAAFINGFQGAGDDANNGGGKYLLGAATAKHWVAYDLEGFIPRTDPSPRPPTAACDTADGGPDGSGGTLPGCQRWNFDASPPQRDLDAFYAYPFKAAVDAGVASIMCSYNAAYGKPTCASPELRDVLREDWGWKGFIVSDYTAVELMQDVVYNDCPHPYPSEGGPYCAGYYFAGHNYTSTVDETSVASLVDGGVDMNLGPFYSMQLFTSYESGAVSEADLDAALRRVYATHLRLGLLDPLEGQPYAALGPDAVDSPEHRQLALDAADAALVLLKNDGGLLPLSLATKVAFIGPHATSTQALLSNYHGENRLVEGHSPYQAALDAGWEASYAKGCNICDDVPPGFPNMPCEPGHAVDTSGFAAAAAAAAAADVAVVFVGLDQTSEAENFDRDGTGLPGVQEGLVKVVLAANPRTVVVLVNGGTVSCEWTFAHAPAVLEAFYGGELGGDAIVRALLGVTNPGGKMPLTTYPLNFTASRDVRDMDLASGQGVTDAWYTGPALFPFGWGLSYTTFAYAWAHPHGGNGAAASLGAAAALAPRRAVVSLGSGAESQAASRAARREEEATALALTAFATNTGRVAGDCVVLAFKVRADAEDQDEPRRTLVGFKRLKGLAPGETRAVTFPVAAKHLAAPRSSSSAHSKNAAGRRWFVAFEVGDVVAPAKTVVEVIAE